MSTDIFTLFDTDADNGGQANDVDTGDGFVFGGDPDNDAQHQAQGEGDGSGDGGAEGGAGGAAGGATGGAEPETVTIKKEDWDRTQQALAEFKGFITAQNSRKPEPERQPEPQRVDPQAQQNQQAQFQQALKARLKNVSDKLLTDPDAALEDFLGLTAQISAAQTQQYVQQYAKPATDSTVDLMIENYITRKSAKDPLYEKVGPKFEELISKYNTSALSGYSRQQLVEALDTVYQRAKGDWADEQYTEAQKKRATTQRQEPTNYGGGRSTSSGGGRTMTIPDTWKQFARDAGLDEKDITPELFKGMK